MKISQCIIYILLILSFHSCFTGIESTPKITYKNDTHEDISNISEEEKYLSLIKNKTFDQWKHGKEFIITDNKLSLVLSSNKTISPLAGSKIKYIGFESNPSVTGSTYTKILFADYKNDTLCYRINLSPKELLNHKNIDIPFTIQQSIINDVRKLLIGKQYYIITSTWYNLNGENIKGKKFIPVTITNIDAGNEKYPISVTFKDNNQNSYCVYMTIGNKIQSTRDFHKLFSFTNPQKKYPKITTETWNYIINSNIMIGMNKDECKLALGTPNFIERLPSNAGVIELWKYDNGYQLLFEDGVLKEYKQ